MVSTENRKRGVRPGPTHQLGDRRELVHQRRELAGVELADPAAVALERVGPAFGVVEQRLDAGDAVPVDQRLEIPGDVGGGQVGGRRASSLRSSVLMAHHGLGRPTRASGSGRACTTISRLASPGSASRRAGAARTGRA